MLSLKVRGQSLKQEIASYLSKSYFIYISIATYAYDSSFKHVYLSKLNLTPKVLLWTLVLTTYAIYGISKLL